ncbi:hypothetical protein BDZ94DRAFT_1316607 [Collybia nuda]|uniref:Uncharacterized protein n=1 Tax=Collybia nuda TaxID=64659 RepID=A0A9P5XSZ9_9AGAR|nr:hypothetical protein BDZ94DRAFT_1316607 [Collybia nuda]
MRRDIQATLKDSETYLMCLINGTPLETPFDFVDSRMVLDGIRVRYARVHSKTSPVAVQERPGGSKAVRAGKGKVPERHIRDGPDMSRKGENESTKPEGSGGVTTGGAGADRDQDLITKSGPIKPALAKKTSETAQKIRNKRNRSSGDDNSPRKSNAGRKRAKKFDLTSDNGTTDSELTPAEESSISGEGDNKADADPAPLFTPTFNVTVGRADPPLLVSQAITGPHVNYAPTHTAASSTKSPSHTGSIGTVDDTASDKMLEDMVDETANEGPPGMIDGVVEVSGVTKLPPTQEGPGSQDVEKTFRRKDSRESLH